LGGASTRDALELRKQLEVLPCREPRVVSGPLRHPADARAHLDDAPARLEGPGEQPEERGLAGAVRADEGNRPAGKELDGHGCKRLNVAEAARDRDSADEG